MKKLLLKVFIANILFIILAISAHAQTTYVWTGATGTDWATAGNWTVGGVVAADYPGHVGTTDIVDIGVPGVAGPSDTTFVFTNQPVLAIGNTVNIASLTFGNNNAPTGTITLNADGSTTTNTTAGIIILTVNGTLNVSGTVLQMHSPTGGGANSGTTTPAIHTPGTTTTAEYTSLLGSGTLHCGYLTMGDLTLPSHDEVSNVTQLLIGGIVTNLAAVAPHTITNPVESNITINIDHDFTMNTISYSNPAGTQVTSNPNTYQVVISRNSDARILFFQGTLNIGGMFYMLNNNATPSAGFKLFQKFYKPQNKLSIRPESDPSYTSNWVTHNANFYYGGPFITFGNSSDPDYLNCVNKIDFYDNSGGISAANSAFTSIVNYNGNNNQLVYSDSDTTHVDIGAYTYSKLIISGSGVKTVRPNGNYSPALSNPGLTVNQTLTVTNSGSGTPTTFDLATNNANLWESGAYQTDKNTIVNSGSGYINFSSGSYTNNGTSNFGTGLVTYNTGSATANFLGNGVTNYTNVKFATGPGTGDGTVNLSAFGSTGTYNILSTGVMQLVQHGTSPLRNQIVNVAGASPLGAGKLNFLSDANGSATLAALPGTCAVNGNGTNITVQRYVSGGSGARGYRLMSSAVYNATDANSNKIYSINHLLNTTYISGTNFALTGTSKPGNPSLYLYRENLVPAFTTFLNSNFRGINTISASPNYTMDLDGGPFDIPIGNGYLFYFRGGAPATGFTTAFTAGSTPVAATLAPSGLLNQGNITVTDWYTPTSTNLGYTTVSGDPTIEGTNLVGNPYPSSIDWNNFSSTVTTAGIYGPNVGPFIYELHPGGQAGAGNYGIYSQSGGVVNSGTNIIASGEGFFVQALNSSAQLTFTENAKINTNTGPTLYMAKLPVTNAAPRYLRLQLALDTINTDEILINFKDNAKATFDPMEDARYKVGTGVVKLASFSSDNVVLAINSMPLPVKGQTIPLKVNVNTSRTYTLNLTQANGIPQLYDIWLKDAFTKDSVNMRKTASYNFTVNLADTTTFGSRRFSIVLSQDTAFAYKLLSFDASRIDNKRQVQVLWKTANEQNYTNFTVERSTDNGKSFDVIGSVLSNGQGTYSLVDKNPAKGENLYKLKQEDFNSTVTYSKVVDVKISDNGNNNVRVHVYPNPAVNNITLDIDPKSQEVATYKIKISNSFGMVVKQVVTTETDWHDNVSQLFTGTYLIQVVNDKDNTLVGQTKFVKL